jgi:phosphoglycolate phosphatase
VTAGPTHLCVFDCDGTMVDSQHGIILSMTTAFQGFGWPDPDAEAVRRIVGLPLVEAVGRLAPVRDVHAHETVAELYKQAFQAVRRDGRLVESLYPGVAAALEALDAAGWLLGVATGKSRRGLELTLAHHGLGHHFVTLQTADSARGKPDPDMLEKAMADAGAAPETTVMIGDTTFDMHMAANAGVLGIGVSWGYHPVDDLRSAGARLVLETCDALPAAVSDLFSTGDPP